MHRNSAGRFGEAAEKRCWQRGCPTSCTAMVNTSSSIQQGQPSQHGPRASLCSSPLPLTLLKPRWRFGGLMQQRDRKENALMKSTPCSKRVSAFAPPALRISPGPGAVSPSWTLPACIFRKQRAWMHGCTVSGAAHGIWLQACREKRREGYVSTFLYFL